MESKLQKKKKRNIIDKAVQIYIPGTSFHPVSCSHNRDIHKKVSKSIQHVSTGDTCIEVIENIQGRYIFIVRAVKTYFDNNGKPCNQANGNLYVDGVWAQICGNAIDLEKFVVELENKLNT